VSRRTVPLLLAACLALGPMIHADGADALVSTDDGAWFWRSPQPMGLFFNAVCWRGDELFGVEEGGSIHSSSDNGATWSKRMAPGPAGLSDITFVDERNGWAVGGDLGAVVGNWRRESPAASVDGSPSSTRVRTRSTRLSAALITPSSRAAVRWTPPTSLAPRLIVRTTDGGATWSQQATPKGYLLNAVSFVDADCGWAVGDVGGIVRTTDGGASWVRQKSGSLAPLVCVAFVDRARGWIGGPRGAILRTIDGGATWRTVKLRQWPKGRVSRIAFTDRMHGWALLCTNGWWEGTWRIAKTSDGGNHWRTVFVAPKDVGLACLAVDGGSVYVAGSNESTGYFAVSRDNGATWTTSYSSVLLDVCDIAVSRGKLSAAVWGTAFCADGRNWLPQISATWWPSIMTMTGSQRGWGIAFDWERGPTLLMRTENGIGWDVVKTFENEPLTVMDFVDDQHGWLVSGAAGFPYAGGDLMYGTSDGGATWSRLAAGVGDWITSVDFVDATNGWLCGIAGVRSDELNGFLMHSTDAGASWTKQDLPQGFFPLDVFFVNEQEGWACGTVARDDVEEGEAPDLVVHTTDGGLHWNPQPAHADTWLMQIEFIDSLHGWALGFWAGEGDYYSELLTTSDGGSTWQHRGEGLDFESESVGDVLFLDAARGWIFSDSTWATTNGGATWAKTAGPRYSSDASVAGDEVFVVGGEGFFSSSDLPAGDSAVPVTYDDFDGRWHNSRVAVSLGAVDIGGGTVVRTEYRVDDDPVWHEVQGPIVFPAPADHSGDGKHELRFRSVDSNGNRESGTWPIVVPIDTAAPVVTAPRATRVIRGRRARLYFRVNDDLSPSARVVITIRRKGARRSSAGFVLPELATNRLRTKSFRCRLAPGRYVFTVRATDLAGNTQSRAVSNTLIVKPNR